MGVITVWKKFCVAILSICLLSGAAMISGSLFASEGSTLQIMDQETKHHYINEAVSFTISSSQGDEKVLYIEGGEIHGNGTSYAIPLQENSDSFTLSGIGKPGAYQGEVKAHVAKLDGSESKELSGSLAFTIYGKAFQSSSSEMNVGDEKQAVIYGELPPTLEHGIITYSSDDERIVSIDQNGKLTAHKEGITQLHIVVFDGIQDEAHVLSKDDCEVKVNGVRQEEVSFDQAVSGNEEGYRFLKTDHVYANHDGEQVIGLLDQGQSGEHAYYFDEQDKQSYEVKAGRLYLVSKQETGTKEVNVYVLHKDTKRLYKVNVAYEVEEQPSAINSSFAFRYDGEAVTSVVRAYQEGKNSFQISSNQSVEDVGFQLKNEVDSDTLTISQTGNITVKKVTKDPVIVIATWQKQTYELPIIIQKADQKLSALSTDFHVLVSDGSFDPLIEGRNGTGVLVGELQGDQDCMKLITNEDGSISLLPVHAGSVSVVIYNDGDENYKKSNIITLKIQIDEAPKDEASTMLEGNESWLHVTGNKGNADWYTSIVSLSLHENANDITGFSYDGAYVGSAEIHENGAHTFPVTFQKADGTLSSPIKVNVQIDTHAPLITSITEQKIADNDVKAFIDRLTFQSVYGNGMSITIQASDALVSSQLQTSGVKEIAYRIYRIEDEQEQLIEEGSQPGEQIKINIEDTGLHKVCARAEDQAGLLGEERCITLSDEEQIPVLMSSNSGLVLMSRAFSSTDDVKVSALTEEDLTTFTNTLSNVDDQVIAAYEFTLNETQDVTALPEVDVMIPITKEAMDSIKGTWFQKQADHTYQEVEVNKQADAQILHLRSLQPIYYVEQAQKEPAEAASSASLLQLAGTETNTQLEQSEPTVVTPIAFQPVSFDSYDLKLFLYAGGGLIIFLFVVLLIRSGREEY